MLCEKNGKRNSETERRIYASGDKLTASLTTVTDPSLPLWMTSYRLQCDSNGFFAGVLDDFLPLEPLHRQTKNRQRYGRDLSSLGIQDKRKFKSNGNKIG